MARYPTDQGPQGADQMPPERLQLEMELDLLADNELPEAERAALLARLETEPGHWRTLALRFMERQAERSAVRDLIAGGSTGAQGLPPTYPFPARRLPAWLGARAVAAVLLVGVLAGLGGLYLGRHQAPPNSPLAGGVETIAVPLPASVLGGNGQAPLEVNVPLVKDEPVPPNPLMAAEAGEPEDGPRHLMIVPVGDNRAVIFPVTSTAKAEIIH